MSFNLQSLPFVHVNELLKNFESTRDLSVFLSAFELAIEIPASRQAFLGVLRSYTNATSPSLEDLRKLFVWAEQAQFKKAAPTLPSATHDTAPEYKAFIKEVMELGAEAGRGDQAAEQHQYRFFRPAWEVQSAFWDQLFGEHDPAITIARYARLSFKARPDGPALPKQLQLTDADILILDRLIDHLKDSLQRCEGVDQKHLRNFLASAIGAEHLFHNLSHEQLPFEIILRSAARPGGLPCWAAQNILQFWGSSIDAAYGGDLSEIDPSAKQGLVAQAKLFGAALINYASDDDDFNANVPKLDYISDRSFTNALHTIDWLRVELDTPDLQHLYNAIIDVIDRARVRKFGGCLPFSFQEAADLYSDAALETWISQIAIYGSDRYENALDRFSCSRYLMKRPWSDAGEKQENKFAKERYRSFTAYPQADRTSFTTPPGRWRKVGDDTDTKWTIVSKSLKSLARRSE